MPDPHGAPALFYGSIRCRGRGAPEAAGYGHGAFLLRQCLRRWAQGWAACMKAAHHFPIEPAQRHLRDAGGKAHCGPAELCEFPLT